MTGSTAVNHDWSEVLRARTPIVLGVVTGLAFLVLLFSFRSVLLPLISVMLNLLSSHDMMEVEDLCSALTVVHEGRVVFLCCEGCVPALKKEPGKYLAKLPK